MNTSTYIDMELSEIETMLSACIALAETLDDDALLRQRNSLITLFYVMRQKLQSAETLAIPATIPAMRVAA